MSGRSAWLRRRPDTFLVRVGCGLIMVAWGWYVIVTASPMHEMAVYDEYVEFVPAWAWGRIAIVVGGLQAGSAVSGLAWPIMQSWPRRATALAAMTFWKVMGVSMFNSGENTPMGVVVCGLALLQLPDLVLPLLRRR